MKKRQGEDRRQYDIGAKNEKRSHCRRKEISLNKKKGYIILWRSILSWQWYKTENMRSVFLHCLMKANFIDKEWCGIQIKRGSFVCTRNRLAEEIGISEQKLRTVLKRLQENEIKIESRKNKYTIITLINYDNYNDSKNTRKSTNLLAWGKELFSTNA